MSAAQSAPHSAPHSAPQSATDVHERPRYRPRTASPWPWARPAPVRLGPGERIVWQDGPRFRALAVRLYHIRLVALYCFGLTLADMVQARLQHLGPWGALQAAIPGTLTTVAALGIFSLLALGSARTARYTLTSERVVMQCGLALAATISMPLHRISAVSVRVRRDGTGDITLLPHEGSTLVFHKLWPFVRPWRFGKAEPMLRDVPAAGYAASIMSRMVADAHAVAEMPEREVVAA